VRVWREHDETERSRALLLSTLDQTASRAVRWRWKAAKPRQAKPRPIIVHVDVSGAANASVGKAERRHPGPRVAYSRIDFAGKEARKVVAKGEKEDGVPDLLVTSENRPPSALGLEYG
jgi:hypothetical protein